MSQTPMTSPDLSGQLMTRLLAAISIFTMLMTIPQVQVQ
jgi:hypothetical protein